jgi:hypothetical protein
MGKTFKETTTTYRMFEELFLNKADEEYPFVIKPISKGRAINLAMGLNTCQVQWQRARGVPDSFIKYSAKAKGDQSDEANWCLEISQNQTKQGRKSKGSFALDELLRGIQEGNQQKSSVPLPETPSPNIPAKDDPFTKWLEKGIEGGSSGDQT